MPIKQNPHKVFIEKRARALAVMLLTRRENLRIEEVEEDTGLDYFVRFHSEDKEGLREFGIKLTAQGETATQEQAKALLRSSLRKMKHYDPFLRPICLFLFTMENDEAWYTWGVEPIESSESKPLLRWRDEPDCHPLDNRALKAILERVDRWHDAVFPCLIANGPSERKVKRKKTKM